MSYLAGESGEALPVGASDRASAAIRLGLVATPLADIVAYPGNGVIASDMFSNGLVLEEAGQRPIDKEPETADSITVWLDPEDEEHLTISGETWYIQDPNELAALNLLLNNRGRWLGIDEIISTGLVAVDSKVKEPEIEVLAIMEALEIMAPKERQLIVSECLEGETKFSLSPDVRVDLPIEESPNERAEDLNEALAALNTDRPGIVGTGYRINPDELSSPKVRKAFRRNLLIVMELSDEEMFNRLTRLGLG